MSEQLTKDEMVEVTVALQWHIKAYKGVREEQAAEVVATSESALNKVRDMLQQS